MNSAVKPYNSLNAHLKQRFGCKVFKVTIDAHLTCPNRDGTRGVGGCVYCDTATLVPKGYDGEAGIRAQLEAGIARVKRRHRAEKVIAYFQINTNTHASSAELRSIYSQVMGCGEVAGLAISTRPDCLGEDVLDILSEIRADKDLWLELGLQSANDATLERINRGHSAAEFADAVRRAALRGIDVCAHVIAGLPGEGRDDFLSTVDFINELGVWGVKFHQLQILRGTVLEEEYASGRAGVLSLEEYAELVVESIERLSPEVVIHRLSGDVPEKFLVAPRWGANKFEIAERVLELMRMRGTTQGSNYRRG